MKKKFETAGSIRRYAFAYLENNVPTTNACIYLDEIVCPSGKDWEYIYAIRDEMDKVLDLKVGERLQMKFNRDNQDSDGFIQRIQ